MKASGTNRVIQLFSHQSYGIKIRARHRNQNIAMLQALFCSTWRFRFFENFRVRYAFRISIYAADIDINEFPGHRSTLVHKLICNLPERYPFFLHPSSLTQRRIVAKIEALFSELDKGVESLKTVREQLKVYRQAVLKHAFEGKLTTKWRKENKDKLESPEQLLDRIQKEREARYQQQLDEWGTAVKEWEAKGKEGKKPTKPRKPELVDADRKSLPELPKEWAWEYVGNLNAEVFDGPFGSNLKTSDYVDDGVRVIRLENIGYLEFIEDKQSYVTVEKHESIKNHTVYSAIPSPNRV